MMLRCVKRAIVTGAAALMLMGSARGQGTQSYEVKLDRAQSVGEVYTIAAEATQNFTSETY
ncbi:MAG TPA: hypothetical protein VG711_00290, partial [Phycisphaerales bacterium]|nr:hypothetical protein [Phycisphaerales bacterium]